jgi:hypothetical protein
MSREARFILLGLAALSFFPASIYSLRHPRRRGDPLGGRRLAAVMVSTAAMVVVIVISAITVKGN